MTKTDNLKPNRKQSILKIILCFHMIAATIIYFLNSIKANLDLTEGRFALFMDEQITFDGVKQILHPHNPFMFLYSILDGGDQRYGRLLWNVSATFAFIPERIFGERGQIFATRMLSTILLFVAAGLLARAFGKGMTTYFLIYTAILSLPFFTYYATMPKPEPLQLFVIGLIANFVLRNSDLESRKLFFLIGLLLGIKISSLSIVLPLVLFIVWEMHRESRLRPGRLIWCLGSFNFGLFIAVPTLFPTLTVVTITAFVWDKWFRSSKRRFLKFFAIGIIGIVHISLVNYLITELTGRDFLMNYLNSTILGTSSGADSTMVTPLSWIEYLLTDWSKFPTLFLLALLALGSALTFRSVRDSDFKKFSRAKIVFLLAGLFSIGLTFITVKRIWGFYLFVGFAIVISASIALNTNCTSAKNSSARNRTFLILASLLLYSFSVISFISNLSELNALSRRTQSSEYRMQMRSYLEIKNKIENYVESNPREFRMALDPSYFQIEHFSRVTIDRFWGPFDGWGIYDFLVFRPSHLPPFTDMAIGTREELAKAKEVKKFYEYVVDTQGECNRKWCYVPLEVLPDKGMILLKVGSGNK